MEGETRTMLARGFKATPLQDAKDKVLRVQNNWGCAVNNWAGAHKVERAAAADVRQWKEKLLEAKRELATLEGEGPG